MSQLVRDAVEFTRLAAKRWRYYAGFRETAANSRALEAAIRRKSHSEVAFILIAEGRLNNRTTQIGLAYCRRTWCHHLALDFLALHPRAIAARETVSGIGSGIVYGLVQLADFLKCSRIWGEATANSAPFYEKLLKTQPILDLFVIEQREMSSIKNRQARIRHPGLVTGKASVLG